MRASASSAAIGGLVAGLAAVFGCSSGGGGSADAGGRDAGGSTGSAGGGGSGMAGSADGGPGGAGGQSTAGASGAGGTAGSIDGGDVGPNDANDAVDDGDAPMDVADAALDGADAGTSDASVIDGAIARVVATEGCGKEVRQTIGMTAPYTIVTAGIKPPGCADSVCGPWMFTRQFFVTLPIDFDNTKPYPLVFEGPGCGGTGKDVYPLNSLDNGLPANDNVDNTVIRVGLTPPPNEIGHALQPNQGCFDEHEGDDSVEWPFYEHVYDVLAQQFCFDKNRVFASGSSTNGGGGWLANELGCKYAGDPVRPIRAVLANNGGLPTTESALPTCTTHPMAGLWISEVGQSNSFPFTKAAIARAMKVNGCTVGTGFDDAMFSDFPVGGRNFDNACKRIVGCPDLTPLVICPVPGTGLGSHPNLANPAFSTFIKLFEKPPLLDQ